MIECMFDIVSKHLSGGSVKARPRWTRGMFGGMPPVGVVNAPRHFDARTPN